MSGGILKEIDVIVVVEVSGGTLVTKDIIIIVVEVSGGILVTKQTIIIVSIIVTEPQGSVSEICHGGT